MELAVLAELLLRGHQTVGELRGRGVGHLLPPDVAVVGECRVRVDAVAPQRLHGVVVGLVARPRGDPEEPGLGVDRVEPTVVAELLPFPPQLPAGTF